MTPAAFAFRVGDVDAWVLRDEAYIMGRARIVKRFPDATEAEYDRAYADLGLTLETAKSAFNVLALRLNNDLILVDSGEGGRPKGGHLPASLSLAGLSPADVTGIIITHTHGDHVLGLLDAQGEPVFPHARYIIAAEELAFWRTCISAGQVDHAPVLAMVEARGLQIIAMDAPILPGLRAVPLPGHTPGQIGLLLESAGERLLHLADLLHGPMQFAHPEWSANFDVDTDQSVPTRRAALQRAAAEYGLTLFYHLPFPGLGRVHQGEKAFVWRPLSPESP